MRRNVAARIAVPGTSARSTNDAWLGRPAAEDELVVIAANRTRSTGPLPRSSPVVSAGTSAIGPEVLIDLERDNGRPLRAQLEDGLRAAGREGRLAAGDAMPSSRALARDLGVSRRLVVDTYAQLVAEGYLTTRAGAGTFVARTAPAAAPPPPAADPVPPRFDFFPGAPDLSAFPRAAWIRALRDVMRTLPAHALGYADPRG